MWLARTLTMGLAVVTAALGCDGGSKAAPGGGVVADAGASDVPGGGRENLALAQWTALAPVPLPRFYVAVTAARGRVFVVGGFSDADARAVHAFDPATGAWTAIRPLPVAFKMANAAGVGNRLFVLGGRDVRDTVEYDFASDTWVPKQPLPVAGGRGAAAVGVYGNQILLAGGILSGQSANSLNTGVRKSELLIYDVATDQWEMAAEMPVENGYAMGAVVGSQFWVMGGSTNFARTDQVLVFDIATRAWSTREPLPKSISSGAVGVLDGRICITGGIASSTGMISPDTLVLDPAVGTWSTIKPLPTPRFATGGAVVGKQFFVATGMASGATPDSFAASAQMEVLSLP